MKNYTLLLILTYLSSLQNMHAEPIINFFLYPYPYAQEVSAPEIHNGLKQPGKIATHRVDGMLNHNSAAGIFSTYYGYIDITNLNGQSFYPRKNQESVLHLIITELIIPVTMFENTIDHWILDKNVPAACFSMEKKQDEKTKLFIWNVQPENRPTDNIIPRKTSLIIIADPQHIYVPIGVSLADNTPNLLLPPIYVKQGMNLVKNSLYMLTISHLFGPSRVLYTKSEKRYVMHTR